MKTSDLATMLTPPGNDLYGILASASGWSCGFIFILAQKADVRKMPWKTIRAVVTRFPQAYITH